MKTFFKKSADGLHSWFMVLLVLFSVASFFVGVGYAVQSAGADELPDGISDNPGPGSYSISGGIFCWASVMSGISGLYIAFHRLGHSNNVRWSWIELGCSFLASVMNFAVGLLQRRLLTALGCPWSGMDEVYRNRLNLPDCGTYYSFEYWAFVLGGLWALVFLSHFYYVYEGIVECRRRRASAEAASAPIEPAGPASVDAMV